LYTEYVDGITVKQQLFAGISEQESGVLADKIGHALALLHQKAGVIHGDLTTSNMIIKKTTASLVVIDFGLSCVSSLTEDKAVDLYVLERAFLSTHPNSEALFQNILNSYDVHSPKKGGQLILKKLEEVRKRGRKKLAFG